MVRYIWLFCSGICILSFYSINAEEDAFPSLQQAENNPTANTLSQAATARIMVPGETPSKTSMSKVYSSWIDSIFDVLGLITSLMWPETRTPLALLSGMVEEPSVLAVNIGIPDLGEHSPISDHSQMEESLVVDRLQPVSQNPKNRNRTEQAPPNTTISHHADASKVNPDSTKCNSSSKDKGCGSLLNVLSGKPTTPTPKTGLNEVFTNRNIVSRNPIPPMPAGKRIRRKAEDELFSKSIPIPDGHIQISSRGKSVTLNLMYSPKEPEIGERSMLDALEKADATKLPSAVFNPRIFSGGPELFSTANRARLQPETTNLQDDGGVQMRLFNYVPGQPLSVVSPLGAHGVPDSEVATYLSRVPFATGTNLFSLDNRPRKEN